MKKGNKDNTVLNVEWANHVRKWGKKLKSSLRRNRDKKNIKHD